MILESFTAGKGVSDVFCFRLPYKPELLKEITEMASTKTELFLHAPLTKEINIIKTRCQRHCTRPVPTQHNQNPVSTLLYAACSITYRKLKNG